ncbi:MAG: transposase [Myxococcota bacterium]
MSKRTYRSVPVNDVSTAALELQPGERIIVAVDVAKVAFKAALIQGERLVRMVAWNAPQETGRFVALVAELKAIAPVELVMESTGTYGDPLREQMARLEVPVFRVSTKHTHDAAELFDGVPSMHDAKAAQVLGWLHAQKRSQPWPIKSTEVRDVAAVAASYELYNDQLMACMGRLEAMLARHFPELPGIVTIANKSTLALLEKYGAASCIAVAAQAASELMRRVGGHMLDMEKVAAVIAAARTTTGMLMTAAEIALMRTYAREALRQQQLKDEAHDLLVQCAAKKAEVRRVAEVIGAGSAAILWAEAGDASEYASPAAYVKALGLNLKIKSSGMLEGKLKITKRGPALARKYLYLAVLRLLQSDAHFKAWHQRKVEREGGARKLKSVVALMRKLASALWHVARGAPFDATKLFDSKRLGLTA